MPILTVKLSASPSPQLTQAVADMLIEATERILKKKRSVTAIVIDYVAPGNWLIAGNSLVEHAMNSVYFDIKITDETNTKDEKAQYITETFAGFARLIGPLHENSYIYVQDVRAAAYGYGGRTQEYRYHQPPA
ncbi:4-oxalocrotonate tautomerase family protein [Azoarcus sp. L1K30]|uniref:tautomerase family protein n=1 Tax=Azoarcus sp. L1K30 TaxID=2820277 RepID=UPI001B82EB02|nr:4-oxalocrotonate tautomerase family protein [Azoarcus sp. L1K30]MBR0568151.1 4-oxalocrotonate tautomerase family protein [Azoarcus sp. L1K30]